MVAFLVLFLTACEEPSAGSDKDGGARNCLPGYVVCDDQCIPQRVVEYSGCPSPSVDGGVPTHDAGQDAGPDTQTDGANCGQLGHACADSELCMAGQCVPDTLDKLRFDVIDAQYSRALDRMILASASPMALHVYDVGARKDVVVNLPVIPTAVSLTPDGRQAVVGHDGYVSYVDLSGAKVLGTFHVSAPVGDVVAGGNGKAYAFPSSDQWVGIHTVDLTTGTEDISGQATIYAGSVAALHPNGKAMYMAERNLSPSSMEKFDITSGKPASVGRNWGGDYPVCGNLWISKNGLRIFTGCGNVFSASDNKSLDMQYAGSIGKVTVVSLDDTADRVAAVIELPPSTYNAPKSYEIRYYESQYLAQVDNKRLPGYRAGTKTVPTKGRFFFFRADGAHAAVVVQADPSSNAQYPFAIATL
ncbi:hypothetical protein LVJ94_11635 [Pendulispora rubella]|uniref:Lipoprotein n=1 Tax=Pendulispora rubella TaxID=2741070 RepID=A0ABZ2LAC8_9BACT